MSNSYPVGLIADMLRAAQTVAEEEYRVNPVGEIEVEDAYMLLHKLLSSIPEAVVRSYFLDILKGMNPDDYSRLQTR